MMSALFGSSTTSAGLFFSPSSAYEKLSHLNPQSMTSAIALSQVCGIFIDALNFTDPVVAQIKEQVTLLQTTLRLLGTTIMFDVAQLKKILQKPGNQSLPLYSLNHFYYIPYTWDISSTTRDAVDTTVLGLSKLIQLFKKMKDPAMLSYTAQAARGLYNTSQGVNTKDDELTRCFDTSIETYTIFHDLLKARVDLFATMQKFKRGDMQAEEQVINALTHVENTSSSSIEQLATQAGVGDTHMRTAIFSLTLALSIHTVRNQPDLMQDERHHALHVKIESMEKTLQNSYQKTIDSFNKNQSLYPAHEAEALRSSINDYKSRLAVRGLLPHTPKKVQVNVDSRF